MTTEPTQPPSSSDVPAGTPRSSEAATGVPAGSADRRSATSDAATVNGEARADDGPAGADVPAKTDGRARADVPAKAPVTRAAVVWVAVSVALVILVLLIIFFIQNQDQVKVHFLGFEGSLALGIALFIAAVGGGILVAFAGGARIVQLRMQERRSRKRSRG
jgi:uncharacterized integral membrane protein